MPTGFDDLPEPCVHTLERVRRVDHAANLRRKGEEGDDARPRSTPGRDDRRKALAPFPPLEGVERTQGEVGARRRVDRAERRRQRLPLFPIREVQALAQQMYDAGLQRRPWEDGREGFLHAFYPLGLGT